jgi:drug/metabolite transporter (DMT)-like permease
VSRGSLARLVGLALLWGSGFLWIKIALRGFSPVQLTLARLALGAAVLAAIVRLRGLRMPRGVAVWAHLTVAALISNAVPYVLFGVGEQHVSSNIAGALNATTPLWTVLIGLAARTEHALSPVRTAGLAVGFAGAVVIAAPWQGAAATTAGGVLACLVAAASYGVGFVYQGRYITRRGLPPLVLAAGQLTAATALLALLTPVAGRQPIHVRADAIAAVLVLGFLGTGAAYVLNYRLITDDGPTLASTVIYLLPVVAVTLGALVLSEHASWQLLAGTAVVLAGIVLSRRRPSPSASTRTRSGRRRARVASGWWRRRSGG